MKTTRVDDKDIGNLWPPVCHFQLTTLRSKHSPKMLAKKLAKKKDVNQVKSSQIEPGNLR